MSELLIGKTISDALYIIHQYELMLDEKPFDEDVLDEALVFINTSKQPSRIKCALIGWNGAKSLITQKGDEKN
jgi:nitrogen fixation NifU-like protein